MQISITPDQNPTAISLSEFLSSGGYSDDTAPFNTRNLFLYTLHSKGPITPQSLPFALRAIFTEIKSRSNGFASEDFKSHDFHTVPNGMEILNTFVRNGRFNGSGGYFPMLPEKVEIFLKEFSSYFSEIQYSVTATNMLIVNPCWNANLLLLNQTQLAHFSFFQYD